MSAKKDKATKAKERKQKFEAEKASSDRQESAATFAPQKKKTGKKTKKAPTTKSSKGVQVQ